MKRLPVDAVVSLFRAMADKLERDYMFQALDNKGQVVASYNHESEARTYFEQSFPGATFGNVGDVRPGEIPVWDDKDDEVGTIRVPKDAGSSPASSAGGTERSPATGGSSAKGKPASKGKKS